jgi:HD-GYP domain-containing protein (c-di-GMP phosphodiesterase class II)
VTDDTHPSASENPPVDDGLEFIEEQLRHSAGVAYSANQIGRVRDLLTRLYAARRTALFYPMEHPATVAAVAALQDVIDQFHAEGVDVPLAFFEGELIFGETLLPEHSILFDQLIRDMTSIGVGSLTFVRGLTKHELGRALSLLLTEADAAAREGGIAQMARRADLPHVDIGEVKVFEIPPDQSTSDEDAKASYDGALDLMREIDSLIRRNKVVSSSQVKGVVRSLVDNVLGNRYAMLELTGLRSHDEYTFYHSANVAILSLALGSQVTTDYRFLSSLGVGSLLHDIGKLTVDLRILNKPGSLTPAEWNLIQQHPVYGAQQAALIPGLDKSAIVVILEHHMRFDGSGYPTRTPNRPQHLASRIVAVADAYDAMTSRRSYSAARVQDAAMSQLVQSAGSSHDPALIRTFVELMGVYPPRTVVRLEDGRTGIVLRPSPTDPLRPQVKIIADEYGSIIDPVVVDLSQGEETGVSHCLNAVDLNIDVDDYM